jgi:hypothetical protein
LLRRFLCRPGFLSHLRSFNGYDGQEILPSSTCHFCLIGADAGQPAQPSPAALRKPASKITADGAPVHSFQSLLRDLATCTLNEMTTTLNDAYSLTLVATLTPIQAQAFSLLAVDPTGGSPGAARRSPH